MRRSSALSSSLLLAALVAALLSGCGGGSSPSGTGTPTGRTTSSAPSGPTPSASEPTAATPTPRSGPPKVIGTVADHLSVPWGLGFLPDGSALVTERDSGRVLHIVGRKVSTVGRIDATTYGGGESGLLGLAVSPDFSHDQRIFLYASTPRDNRVLRLTFRDGRLSRPTPILTGIPQGFRHDGGRLAFGPDGRLYVSTGETGQESLAQDRGSLAGKILRITQDGRPAPGNPDPGSPVWTLGHRNVQGLAFDADGKLWASEFGDHAWDELNLIARGHNYGWPRVEGKGGGSRYRDPQVVWPTSEASPSGLAFLDGHLWLASLRGERLWRVDVHGRKASHPVAFFVGKYGRMRTVAVSPGGNLWVTTSNRDGRGDPKTQDDRILLVSPGG
ncbi:PQQ-dependent sugar dehydrogenase [Nocardioides marmorisolisilvae]|uniref:PQQ-dependent sugar dehydrogenase n=1 Tax=Nocardioides marmorisolisilvae TaxID=1542737 RepID=A0A3N0DWF5_9ACTN|nr:PQQ-dependent sugar dehydrogenase [Nocardioides marmorisolisilvae]RNL79925.1 PQQ-dependent sugar dehydrogenase [Nocardioides marmorisolisilvae]